MLLIHGFAQVIAIDVLQISKRLTTDELLRDGDILSNTARHEVSPLLLCPALSRSLPFVELRRINDTTRAPIIGLPYTSRSLMQCFDEAAAAFGWARRDPQIGSMRDGDWLVGWG